METLIIIEKISAGLRRLGKNLQPDYFLFRNIKDWCWDKEEILNIPVIHTGHIFADFFGYGGEECPFLPCYKRELSDDEKYEIFTFARKYLEY